MPVLARHVGFAARHGDDVPVALLEQMRQQIAAYQAGSASDQRDTFGHESFSIRVKVAWNLFHQNGDAPRRRASGQTRFRNKEYACRECQWLRSRMPKEELCIGT